jgi:hypothetical protein
MRENNPRGPWCPQHKCHPDECFEIHYPDSTRGTPVDYQALLHDKLRKQNESILAEQRKMSRSAEEAKKAFEAGRRARVISIERKKKGA